MKDFSTLQERIDGQHGLLRILYRGIVIDAQAKNGCIINLTVRADKKYGGTMRRFLQRLSNAIYRAGDLLNPRNDKGLPRIVEVMMGRHPNDDSLPNSTDMHVIQRLPIYLPNGDASYEAFSIYEGIESKEGHFLGAVGADFVEDSPNAFVSCAGVLNKRTGDLHIFP